VCTSARCTLSLHDALPISADVARSLDGEYDRTAFYSVLKGATTEPRLSTLVVLCRALEVNPTQLLQLAELWPYREWTLETLDLQDRKSTRLNSSHRTVSYA